MKETSKLKVLKLYPEYHTLYGPYIRKDGRKIVILYDGKRRSARQFAKIKLEVKLGRRLDSDEEVDHIDEDFTNNRMCNLQPLSKRQNLLKATKNKLHKTGVRLYGQNNPNSKIPDFLMAEMLKARLNGCTVYDILYKFKPNVTYEGLCKALRRNMVATMQGW